MKQDVKYVKIFITAAITLFLVTLGIQDYSNGLLINLHAYYWLSVKAGFATFGISIIIGIMIWILKTINVR